MSARDEILRRVRAATADVRDHDPVSDLPIEWRYGRATPMDDLVGRFVERVADYQAEMHVVRAADVADTIDAICLTHQLRKLVAPSGLDPDWLQAARRRADVVVEGEQSSLPHGEMLSKAELDAVHAVITAARVGIAETGTIVLDHAADQGRRALTLIPDAHICLVRADQVVSDVPEAVALLADSVAQRRPLTWISGPSATSDIELARVEGVHGPRSLIVIVIR